MSDRKIKGAENLAKARQIKKEKQEKQKELEKYIIIDSDDSSSESDEYYPPPKRQIRTRTVKGSKKQPKKTAIDKAEAIMNEINELKKQLKEGNAGKNGDILPKEPVKPKEEPIPVEPPKTGGGITPASYHKKKIFNF